MSSKSISFNPTRDIPSLSGKIIMVTGGNSGLGRETTKQLARHNPDRIYLAARSRTKAEEAIASIRKELSSSKALNSSSSQSPSSPSPPPAREPEAPPMITFLPLDLSSYDSIRSAAAIFASSSPRLDILINNAGVMHSAHSTSAKGHEIHMATNLLGPALFTTLLLPSLSNSPSPRIVFVASELEAQAPISSSSSYCFRLSQTTSAEGSAALAASTTSFARYGLSKVATIHYASALARRYPLMKVVSVHPGVTSTGLSDGFSGGMNPLMRWLVRASFGLVGTTVEKGALNQLWAGTTVDEGRLKSGEFYFPVGVEGKGSALARDEKASEVLWEWVRGQLKGEM